VNKIFEDLAGVVHFEVGNLLHILGALEQDGHKNMLVAVAVTLKTPANSHNLF
jgi:hypothetical protein